MPDWLAIGIGTVLGVLMGLGLGYILLVWYMNRDRI